MNQKLTEVIADLPHEKQLQIIAAVQADQEYQGWPNHPTWCVNLWINNEQETYNRWKQAARQQVKRAPSTEQVKAGTWTAEEAAKFNLADQLKDSFTDVASKRTNGLLRDLAMSAMEDVEWHRVAEALLEGIEIS